jgi:hypothetical protein
MAIKGRTVPDDSVNVSYCNQYLRWPIRHFLSGRTLIKVSRVVVVNGAPEKTSAVTNLHGISNCRRLDGIKLGKRFFREVRQQATLDHNSAGDPLQDTTVMLIGNCHTLYPSLTAPSPS